MQDKHPTEIIQELDFEIHNLESFIEGLHTQILVKFQKMKLEKLKLRKQSLLNYLNENEGYLQCQKDMADKKYTEEDVINLMSMATKWDTFKDGDVEYEMNMNDFFKYLINSLNKQD